MDFYFTFDSAKRFIYLILLVALTYVFCLPHGEYYWLISSAFIFSLIMGGATFVSRITLILATGFCSILAVFGASVLATISVVLIAYLVALTFLCMFLGYRHPQCAFSCIIINFFALLAAGTSPTDEMMLRILLMLGALLLVCVLQLIFWPYFLRNKVKTNLLATLQHLKALNQEIFSCFLQPDYPNNTYLFERRLHQQKNQVIKSYCRLQKSIQILVAKKKHAYLTTLMTQLTLIYDTLLDSAALRFRVSDHTVFELCAEELRAILQAMNKALAEASALVRHKKYPDAQKVLEEKWKALDLNYQQILQVTAREPLAFLVFIASLQAFQKEIRKFCDTVRSTWRI